jgi:hypothetical protein
MGKTLVPPPVRYLVEEDGRRVGVVLDWEDYQNLQATFSKDPDLLTGIDEAELQVLAEGILSSRYQERLNELLQRNREEGLSASEERELDSLLERIDSMNALKARATYTLQQRGKAKDKEALG